MRQFEEVWSEHCREAIGEMSAQRLPVQMKVPHHIAGRTTGVSEGATIEEMVRKASVVIEKDENGFYAWCPELKACHSQGDTLDEAMANIREAIELYLETLSDQERTAALSQEILTTAIEVHA